MRTLRRTILSLPTLVLLTAAAAGAEAPLLSSVALGGGGLTLQPLAPYDSAVLTVAGEGRRVFRRAFAPGAPIAFTPADADGPLADGAYRWELRLVAETAFGEERPGPGVARQSGSFRVLDGRIVEPAGAGPEAAGPATATGISIANAAPGVVFEDTTSGDDDYRIGVDGDVMAVVRQGTEEILTIKSGTVGLFEATPDPNVSLHISTGTAVPSIRFEVTNGAWDVRLPTNDLQFVDSDELFPPIVLELEQVGGKGSAYELHFRGAGTTSDGDADLFVDGDGNFTGTVTDGSSRAWKRDLEPASSAELLAALADLPLYAWTYKKDPDGVRHLGPMAEDFHAAFGLGKDDQHISPGDSAGLALAAIQALTARLEAKERRIDELERRLQALERANR